MISLDELITEFNRLKNRPSEGLTTRELAAQLGMHEKKVRQIIRVCIEQGMVTVTTKNVQDISGKTQVVPAYIIRGKNARKNRK